MARGAPDHFYIWNPQGNLFKNKSKLVWNAPVQFAYKILKQVLSKSIRNWPGELLVGLHVESFKQTFQNPLEIGLESSCLLIKLHVETFRNPFQINRNWSGDLWANFHMESLRNPFQNPSKIWLGISIYIGILEDFLSKTIFFFESSWSTSIWKP